MNGRTASTSAFLLVIIALSGCFGGGTPAPATDSMQPVGDGGGAPPPASERREAAAPDWPVGRWWTWEVTGQDLEPVQVTTVVAQAKGGTYRIGAADVAPALDTLVLHLPPIGAVEKGDLSWQVHEEPAGFLEFPLTDGKRWTGTFEGNPLTLTARLDAGVFHVESVFEGTEDVGPRLVYDPAIGQVTQFALHYGSEEPFSSARLTGHGDGYEGPVRVLQPLDKFLGVAFGPPEPPAGPAHFSSSAEKTWLVFGCYLGGRTGHYQITFVPPLSNEDPERCALDHLGGDFTRQTRVLHRASVPGDWTVLFEVAGDGYAEAEVLGAAESACRLGPANGGDGDDLSPC